MKKYFVCIYCPPYPPCKPGGISRQTKEVFSILKKAGVENIFGHLEDEYGDYKLIDKSMDICDSLNLKYYPRPSICKSFLQVSDPQGTEWHKGIAYFDRSEKEQKEIVDEFIKEMKHFSKHSSFGGVMFGDESPMPTFKAIGVAREAFHKEFPNKEFHYNLINYMISDENIYGSRDPKYKLTGELEEKSENRFNRYNFYLKNYFDNVNVETLTMDAYPYMTYWKDLKTTIHRSLHETSMLFAEYKKNKPGLKIMNYIQLGAWDNSVRIVNKAEIALNINVQLAYNGDGFIFFPGVTPNDFINDPNIDRFYINGNMGFVDENGKATRYVDIVKPLIDQAQEVAKYVLESKYLGTYVVGEFISGFDKNVDISKLPDNDAIYIGQEMPLAKFEGNKPDISADGQLLIGVFNDSNKPLYMVVNNSIVKSVKVNIDKSFDNLIIDGKLTTNLGQLELPAGEMILVF